MTRSKRQGQRYLACLVYGAALFGVVGCAPQAILPPPEAALDTKVNTEAEKPSVASVETTDTVAAVYQPQSLALIQAYQKADPELSQKAHAIIDPQTKGKDTALALNVLALQALDAQELDLARLYAQRAALADPEFDEAHLALGRIATAQARYNEAIKHYERAAELNPKRAMANVAATALLLDFLDIERALAKAQAAVKAEPQNCQAIAITADAHMAKKNFKEAVEHYESFQKQAKCQENERLLQNLAKIYEVHLQEPQKACHTYQQLLDISPNNANYKASRDYQCQQKK